MRPWKSNLLVICASILIAIAVSEVVLRLIGFSYPSFFVADPTTGYWHRPLVSGWYREEGEAYVQINSAGLRDHEHNKAKPADTFRIAILGDSYAEALQVDVSNTFWSVMQEALSNCPRFSGRKVEAINFGMSGFSTAQELLTLRHRVWEYSPDLVLLAFLTGNDVRDNLKVLAGSYPRPYFELQGDSLVLDNSFTGSLGYRIKDHFLWRLLQSLSDSFRALQLLFLSVNRASQAQQASRQQELAVGEGATPDDQIYLSTMSVDWQAAWAVTGRLLEEMEREVTSHKAEFLVVSLTNGIQAHPDPDVRKRYMERTGISNIFTPDEIVSRISKAKGIRVWVLAPVFQEYAEKKGVFLHGFSNAQPGGGHWNEQGHRVAGEYIASRLCRESGRNGKSGGMY